MGALRKHTSGADIPETYLVLHTDHVVGPLLTWGPLTGQVMVVTILACSGL